MTLCLRGSCTLGGSPGATEVLGLRVIPAKMLAYFSSFFFLFSLGSFLDSCDLFKFGGIVALSSTLKAAFQLHGVVLVALSKQRYMHLVCVYDVAFNSSLWF